LSYHLKTVKIGILGTGGRGSHARIAHRPELGWEIIAGCDINSEFRDKFQKGYPEAQIFADYQDLLNLRELDAVFVMTPDYCHEQHAVGALSSGKAVYLEKPMHITVAGCDHILETAMKTGSKLFVGHNMRYFPYILKMK
jgi:predicted dehydrogenase